MIPERELTSDYFETQVPGLNGTYWVDSVQCMRLSPYPQADIDDEIQKLKQTLDEVYCLTPDEWKEIISRDNLSVFLKVKG